MLYRNNLSTVHENRWFEVVEPFQVHLLVGISQSNTFVGSSMCYGNVWRRIMLPAGTRIADVFGGVEVVLPGGRASWPTQVAPTGKHPFERSSPLPEKWPVEKLREIPEFARPPSQTMPPLRLPGNPLGSGGIDSWTEEPLEEEEASC